MKSLKFALLTFALMLVCFSACTNDEPVIDEQNIEESEAVNTALTELASRMDVNGNFASTQNPTGNVVFDFCFNFVFPIDLSYNNGTTVTVNDFDELITVLINSTNDLFINGIAYPFDVEVYNDDNDAIEIVTINNEEEFIELLDDCDFEEFEDCICTEEYDPVCVEVTDPSGESFIISYPNECYAECDGFTDDDFVDDCDDDFNGGWEFECFEFVYPINILINDGESVTINDEDEFYNTLYNVYAFEFEYPFSIILDEDDEIISVANELEFLELLEDCYDDFDDECDCELEEDPVCVEVDSPSGTNVVVFPNECFAICAGFSEEDIVDCDNTTPDCSEEDYMDNLVECSHDFYPINSNEEYSITFYEDGTLDIESEDESYTTSGTWEFAEVDPNGFQLITITEEFGDFDDTWGITGCESEFVYMFSVTQSYVIDVSCE